MEHMKDLFSYLWLLNSHTNSLLEPNELTRELLDGFPGFHARLDDLTAEERDYVRKDLKAAHAYLSETTDLLVRLEQSLNNTGLLEGGDET